MYHHIAESLLALSRSLRVSRVRRLTPNEIQTIEQGGLKLHATLNSLEDSRVANQLLQTQLDRVKELIRQGKFGQEMELLVQDQPRVP